MRFDDGVRGHGVRFLVLLLAVASAIGLFAACGDGETSETTPPPDAGTDADGGPDGCAPGQTELDDGGCQAAGVPPENCGKGFETDNADGCKAILPKATCPKGLLAVPGDVTCREVMSCGTGTWGDIPFELGANYVDASFTGVSNGSESGPWKTIQEAVDNAPSGGMIAIAEGTYQENVLIIDRPARLWGRCPSKVTIVSELINGQGGSVEISNASGSEVHGIAVTGKAAGIYAFDSIDVVIDRVWAHDALAFGIGAQSDPNGHPMAMHLTGSLVEFAGVAGVFAGSANVTIDDTAVRDTQVADAPGGGVGIAVQVTPGVATTSVISLSGMSIERNYGVGVAVGGGSKVTMDSCFVRDTIVDPGQGIDSGVQVEGASADGTLPSFTARKSVFEANSVVATAATLDMEDTVVRYTESAEVLDHGVGIDVTSTGTTATTATINRCLIDTTQSAGIQGIGSDITMTGSIVRGTLRTPNESNGSGMAVVAQDATTRGSLVVRSSVIEGNENGGVIVAGIDLTFDRSESSHNLEIEVGGFGVGLTIFDQTVGDSLIPATATITSSAFLDNLQQGVLIECRSATIADVTISGTKASKGTGTFGDGLSFIGSASDGTSASVTRVDVSGNHRAGIANFGAKVTVSASTLTCNGFDLDAETNSGAKAVYDDQGGNVCGCGGKSTPCKALSTDLTPPVLPMVPN